MDNDQPRTIAEVYEKKLRDHLAAKGDEWTFVESERNEEGYLVVVLERGQLRHRVRGPDRVDALRRMIAELRIQ